MKFSYRVVAVGLVLLILLVLYYTWETSRTAVADHPSIKFLHSHPWQRQGAPVVEYHVINNDETCHFQKQPSASADIRTLDILKTVNAEYKLKEEDQQVATPAVSNHDDRLEVIVLPHSHSDPGWLKTVNEYFEDQTRATLDNMVKKLTLYPEMTFVWAESVFFSMWWETATADQKVAVRRLVKRGQLEVAVGSWVVPDEANTHYFALIDQMIEGHQWLYENIGAKPNVTWSLDPFGYSSTLPYLYERAGYKNMVILRVNKKVKEQIQRKKSLEFKWRQAWDESGRHDIHTLMMPYMLYNVKHSCGPDTYVCLQFDFRNIPGEVSESRAVPVTDSNVHKLSETLLDQYRKKAALYPHNVVLIPLGDDFRYDRSLEWDQQYKNYMKLFTYMNEQSDWNVNARFGTINDYMRLVNKYTYTHATKAKLPVVSGDFFPYTDRDEEYWTGYFTSRPFAKNLGRELETYLRAADILQSFATARARHNRKSPFGLQNNMKLLQSARRSLGLFQHHDGITGTAKDFVMEHYEEGLRSGLLHTKTVMLTSLQYLLTDGKSDVESTDQYFLDMDDIHSLKPLLDKKKMFSISVSGTKVTFYNSAAQRRYQMVRLLVNSDTVEVKSTSGDVIPCQVNPVWKPKSVLSLNQYELVFFVDIGALSTVTYTLRNARGETVPDCHAASIHMFNVQNYQYPRRSRFSFHPPTFDNIILENQFLKAVFSYRDGYLRTITTKADSSVIRANLEFLMYKSRGSGAYIFSPSGPAIGAEFSHKPVVRVIKGRLMSEVQVVQKFVTHTVIMTNSGSIQSAALEVFNVVDITRTMGKEIIMRLTTNISSGDTFYTDMNGYQMVRRRRFFSFPLQANYYPMTSVVHIEDENTRLSLISTQPHGTTSAASGQVEAMLDRRLSLDDGRGLGEGVLDNQPTSSRFLILLERRKEVIGQTFDDTQIYPSLVSHTLTDMFLHPVFTFVDKKSVLESASVAPAVASYKSTLSLLSTSLSCDVQLINIRSLITNQDKLASSAAVLLNRIGYQCGFPTTGLMCSVESSGKVSLNTVFKDLYTRGISETSLSLMHEKVKLGTNSEVVLSPMETYTYRFLFP